MQAAMLLLLAVFTTTVHAQSTDPIVTGYFPLAGNTGTSISENFPMLIDGDKDTKWCVTDQSDSYFIEFSSNEEFVPTGYVMTTCNDTYTNPGRNPKSWVIKAKRYYGEVWTEIANVTNDEVLYGINATDFEFEIEDYGFAYKFFRFEVTEIQDGDIFQLAELQFRGHPEGPEEPEIFDISTFESNFQAWDGDILTGTLTGNYMISIEDGATVTLNNVTINGTSSWSYQWAGITCEGDATIVLEGNNYVKGFMQQFPGIYVPSGFTLTIKGSGSLIASSNGQGAGIGGGTGWTDNGVDYDEQCHCGNIIIEGGIITATGSTACAGIGGGGYGGSCGDIIIRGGSITAKGGFQGAGIGSGYYSSCGDITITNDVTHVYATKGTNAKSIGAGYNGTCGTVTIGGDVYSNGVTTSPFEFYGRRISLADGTAYTQTEDYYATTATYTKTLGEGRKGNFQAWCVPFDYTITSADTEKFKFYKINMIANSPTPSQDATDDIWVFLKPIGAGDVLHANMPYVYKPLDDMESYSFTSNNVILKAKNNDVLLNMETAEDIYSVYGIFENTSPSASDPFYYINYYGGISLGNSNSVTVGPYRWIIRKESKFGDTTSYAPAMRFFDDEEDDDPTSIQTTDNGQQTTEATRFDLNGCRLSGKPTQKGIYIHNGSKVAVK